MFLNLLKKSEKVVFLKIAHYIARIDGEFADAEKGVIQKYCMEMEIEDISFDGQSFNFKDELKNISNKEVQKIFLLEIMALIYSDDRLDDKEKDALDVIVKEFDLNEALTVVYASWAKSMLSLYVQGQTLIKL